MTFQHEYTTVADKLIWMSNLKIIYHLILRISIKTKIKMFTKSYLNIHLALFHKFYRQ